MDPLIILLISAAVTANTIVAGIVVNLTGQNLLNHRRQVETWGVPMPQWRKRKPGTRA